MRVPRAWGEGGEAMAEAAWLELPYPETGVVEAESLPEQTLALATDLPERPLVLGGCCCAHIGAFEGLAARHDRLALVWMDAHGDLNTIESSPSGNPWATPLRTLIDAGAVAASNVALVGARNLDPPEEEFIAANGLHTGLDGVARATEDVDCVYVAFDFDVLDPADARPFMPEPNGVALADAARLLSSLAARKTIVGLGLTAALPDPANLEPAQRLAAAALQPSG